MKVTHALWSENLREGLNDLDLLEGNCPGRVGDDPEGPSRVLVVLMEPLDPAVPEARSPCQPMHVLFSLYLSWTSVTYNQSVLM